MPETRKSQSELSWNQSMYKDKLYIVPRNESDFEQAYGVVVRKDLREKYNIPEIKSIDDYEKYLYAIAENEKDSGMFGLYNFPSLPTESILMVALNNWQSVSTLGYYWDADEPGILNADTLKYIYTSDEYLAYAKRMAEWAKKGVWPSNAITGSTHTTDLFKESKSASDLCMYKAADLDIQEMKKKGIAVEFFNILDETTNTRISPFHYDSVAITSFSKNPERAALALDVMKNDYEVNNLLQGGIEGEHYLLNPADNTHSNGPKSSDYQWSNWAWSLRSQLNPGVGGLDPSVVAVRKLFGEKDIDPKRFPVDGFSFDDTGLSAEVALMSSIAQQYKFSFDLGVFGDETEEAYHKFVEELTAAGSEKVTAAMKEQLKTFLDNQK
jgi:ABC-type glycerol-3-phosphate transport system substrate-binding protein